MATCTKSWSRGPVLTVSAVKETQQLHRAGCLCLLRTEGGEENEKRIEGRKGKTNRFVLVVKN